MPRDLREREFRAEPEVPAKYSGIFIVAPKLYRLWDKIRTVYRFYTFSLYFSWVIHRRDKRENEQHAERWFCRRNTAHMLLGGNLAMSCVDKRSTWSKERRARPRPRTGRDNTSGMAGARHCISLELIIPHAQQRRTIQAHHPC